MTDSLCSSSDSGILERYKKIWRIWAMTMAYNRKLGSDKCGVARKLKRDKMNGGIMMCIES